SLENDVKNEPTHVGCYFLNGLLSLAIQSGCWFRSGQLQKIEFNRSRIAISTAAPTRDKTALDHSRSRQSHSTVCWFRRMALRDSAMNQAPDWFDIAPDNAVPELRSRKLSPHCSRTSCS